MKAPNLPPIRVEASFLGEIESVLEEGETLSAFVESSVHRAVELRKTMRSAFMVKGLSALAKVEAGAATHTAEAVMDHLKAKL